MSELIRRESLAEKLSFMCAEDDDFCNGFNAGIKRAQQLLDSLPAVDAVEVVRHGEWITKRFGIYICSECGVIHIPILSKPNKRCPKCEAKMDGGNK